MINTNVYGTSDTWPIVGTEFQQGDDNNYYLADFGSGTYDKSTFKTAVDNGRLTLNSGVDKSLAWCGVGNFSTLSNVEYYNRKQGDDFKMFNKDSRTITNFALLQRMTTWSLASPLVGTWYYADTSNTTYGGRARWSPRALDGTTSTNSNFNMGLKPFTQIPIKNCVCVPVVHVKSTITDVSSSTVRKCYLWDYLNINNDVNYNTHPYILNAGFQMWGTLNGTGARSNRITDSFIAVTDDIAAGNGQPYDVSTPAELQGNSIQLYAFGKNYGTSQSDPSEWLTIFGAISSNTNFIPIPTTNDIKRQAGATMVLPHDNGAMTDPVNGYRIYYVQYYDGFEEWLKRQIACFGLFFTDDKSTAESGDLDSELMCLGTLVDGVGNGAYTHGKDNRDQPQWNWNSTNDSTYDPSNPPRVDPNTYDGVMDTASTPLLLATATERYVIADTNMSKLLTKLWDVMALADPTTMTKSDYALDMFLTNNPIDAIVSLQYIPVKDMGTGSTTVALGKYDTNIPAAHAETSVVYDCGTIEIFPRCGDNWIDREMKLTLYLPFCGVVDLDPETYLNRFCNVEYLIDLTTGTCSAVVSFISDNGNRVITDIANGVCAIDLPVTGLQQQTLNSQLFNASESTKQLKVNNAFKEFKSLMGAVSSVATAEGDPIGAINGLLGAGLDIFNGIQSEKIADYNLQHTIIPTKMIGTSGGLTGVMATIKPTIIYSIPVNDVNYSAYGHSIGFACCKTGSLSGFSGYTECTNVDLSGFTATTTEKNMIQSALAGGVYL